MFIILTFSAPVDNGAPQADQGNVKVDVTLSISFPPFSKGGESESSPLAKGDLEGF